MTSSNEIPPRTSLIVFVVLILLITAAAVLVLLSRPEPVEIVINPPAPSSTPAPTNTPEPILVYVTGAVRNPLQTVSIPADSRVQDAIRAAGGLTEDADPAGFNPAARLRDGDQVHIPSTGDGEAVALPTAPGGNLIAVNTASEEELQRLPGIGPALAARIITHREQIGPFVSVEDLDAVPGIGPALLEQIAPFIIID